MKTTLYSLTLLTFVIFAFLPNSFAEEYFVRQVSFYPSDRVPPQDIDTTLDKVMEDVQKFYADEMERHGFGRKTFRFETDAAGNQVRHHIRGNHTDADYWINDTHLAGSETLEDFDDQRFINLVYSDK